MNPGLVYLLRKGPRALLRKLRRRFSGTKGKWLLAGAIFLLLMVIGPQIVGYFGNRDVDRQVNLARYLRTFGPLGLLLMIGAASSKGALHFKPAEIQFLFPAPLGRKDLLLYNVLGKLRIQVLSGLWIAIFTLPYVDRWYAALVAPVLLLAFLQLTTQTAGLLLAAIGERVAKPLRRLGLLVIAVLLVAAFLTVRAKLPEAASFLDTAQAVVDLPAVWFVSWLTRPFVELYLAGSVGALLTWSAICVVVLALELGLMMLLDVAYGEAAVAHAQKVQQAMSRMRSGGGAFAGATRGSARRRICLPRLPYWNGAGPIAWRQFQELARNYRGALMFGLIMFMYIALTIFRMSAIVPVILILLAMPLMTVHLAYDFRRDLDRMTILKSLPLSPRAIAAGQLIPTAVLLSAWEAVGILTVALVTGELDSGLVVALLLILLPLNWLVVAVDNVIFLLLPYRFSKEPGNFTFMGRLMIVMFLKMVVIGLLGGIAFLAAYLTWSITGELYVPAGVVAAVVLCLAALPLTFAVAGAFRGFDVSREIEG